jgi:hypothetical protein
MCSNDSILGEISLLHACIAMLAKKFGEPIEMTQQ